MTSVDRHPPTTQMHRGRFFSVSPCLRVRHTRPRVSVAVSHDPQFNVVAVDDPLGRRAESHVLDENERVVAVTNLEGQVMTHRYALGGMAKSETRFDGTSVAYALGDDAPACAPSASGVVLREIRERIASWTGGAYEHDAAGCVTRIVRNGTMLDLAWNGQYQLVSVATNGVFAESYAYDALGRRVSTTNEEGTERHVYDESWQVIADVDVDGNVVRPYEWGEGVYTRDFAVQHIGLYAEALHRRGAYAPSSPEAASLRRALVDTAGETRMIVGCPSLGSVVQHPASDGQCWIRMPNAAQFGEADPRFGADSRGLQATVRLNLNPDAAPCFSDGKYGIIRARFLT